MTALVTGLVLGNEVWLALVLVLVVFVLVTTAFGRRHLLPTIFDVARWFLGCWLGRFSALVLWTVAGWHLFCQRP